MKWLPLACLFSAPTCPAEVPPDVPFPPFSEQIPWTLLITKNVSYSGKLIRLQGWLSVIEDDNKNIEVRLFQDSDSLRAYFIQSSVGILLTEKTFNYYEKGNKEAWLKLHGRPVYLTGYFKFNEDWLEGERIGTFDEPVFIDYISLKGDTEVDIRTIDAQWKK